ncbi:hypothetical protein EV715DRAFT_214417, partial [Schizophyllum commune]
GWRRFGPQGANICDYVPRFQDTPKIKWPTNVTSIGPYIPEGSTRKGRINKLKWDYTYAANVAKKFKSSRDRPDLCRHATFTTAAEAIKLVRECMSKGIPLVFDEFPDSLRWASSSTTVDDDPFMDPLLWSDDDVHGMVGACLHAPRDFQDAGKREEDALNPYITATLSDFHTWLKKPGMVRCILDLTCGLTQPDDITNRVADNVRETVSSAYGNKYTGHYNITADMMKTQDWFLLHTGGFLTSGHIDGSGMATSAQIRGAGMKEWVVYKATKMPTPNPGDSRVERERKGHELVERVGDLVSAASNEDLEPQCDGERKPDWQVDGCVIELRPGMMYFQPSGMVHGVFTPVPTAAAGKHFFTYDDLHRVEVARRVQVVRPGITNHDHNCGVQLMLISMAAALPGKAASKRVFFRKPMVALALMLTRPQDYFLKPERLNAGANNDAEAAPSAAESQEWLDELHLTERLRSPLWARNSPFNRLAHIVAERILDACRVKYPGDTKRKIPGREYIFEGASWEDPGPPLDVHALTYDLINKHVDDLPKGREEDSSSDSDLTDLDDL